MKNKIGRLGRALLIIAGLIVCSLSALAQDEFQVVQLCDTQLGYGGYEHDKENFRIAVKQINELNPDLVVICGDLVNDENSDEAVADFNTIFDGFTIPAYRAAGNHDVGNEPTVESLERYRRLQGADYYAFDHKGFTFVIANTQLWKAPVEGESGKHDTWFEAALQEAHAKGNEIVIVTHYPPFVETADEAEHYFNLNVTKRSELLALCERYGVSAWLAGHIHRNSVQAHGGMQVVASGASSKNGDRSPVGFRVWWLGGTNPYPHEFVELKQPAQSDR